VDVEILDRYESYLRDERRMASRSVRDYLDAFRLLSSRLNILDGLDYKSVNDEIRRIKEEKGYGQASVYKFSICVRHLFKWLVRERYRHDNPFPFSEWKKARPASPKFLTQAQFDSLIDENLTHLELTLIWLLWDTGIRIGECEQLTQQNVDLEKGLVTIPFEISKGHYSHRIIPISQKCIDVLKVQFSFAQKKNHDKAIFLNGSEPMTRSGMQKIIYKIGLRHGIRLSPHQFRHSCGIRWLEKNVPQVIVQKWLGHQTLQMTSRYISLDAESSRRMFEKYLACG